MHLEVLTLFIKQEDNIISNMFHIIAQCKQHFLFSYILLKFANRKFILSPRHVRRFYRRIRFHCRYKSFGAYP